MDCIVHGAHKESDMTEQLSLSSCDLVCIVVFVESLPVMIEFMLFCLLFG